MSSPLVTAAVDAAGVAWLAQRFAEREVFGAGEKKRAAAVRQFAMANRQLQKAIKRVVAARSTAESATKKNPDSAAGATGPWLFEKVAGEGEAVVARHGGGGLTPIALCKKFSMLPRYAEQNRLSKVNRGCAAAPIRSTRPARTPPPSRCHP